MKHRTATRWWVAVLVVALSGLVCTASNLVFILDASNSMNKPFGDQTRIDAAKAALITLLPSIGVADATSLYVFGHRIDHEDEVASCQDIEALYPVMPENAADDPGVHARIRDIVAQGMTPIAGALRKVAEDLGEDHGQTMIILLTDSNETCGGDPLAVARRLAAMEPKVTLDIIGLNIPEDECDPLDEIASATGGTYCGVGTASDLLDALYTSFGGASTSGTAADSLETYARYGVTHVIRGTSGDDVLYGTAGNDLILGYGGNDLLVGMGGDDVIVGGAGNDVLEGSGGRDILYGGEGDDVILGGEGDDTGCGGAGDDVLEGEAGDDRLHGGEGSDALLGGSGNNLLYLDPADRLGYQGVILRDMGPCPDCNPDCPAPADLPCEM